MHKIILCTIIALTLTGCSKGNPLSYSSKAFERSDLTFVGIPTVFGVGITGTTFPITPNYSLTAKHVAKYSFNSVLAYHPDCDIAIIKHNNSNKIMPNLNQSYFEENIENYGYSFVFAMPVSSSGTIKYKIYIENSYNTESCPVLFSDAGVRAGMSGGPVYNSKDEVIGVNIAHTNGIYKLGDPDKKKIKLSNGKDEDGLLFVDIGEIRNWLETEINKTEDRGKLNLKF